MAGARVPAAVNVEASPQTGGVPNDSDGVACGFLHMS